MILREYEELKKNKKIIFKKEGNKYFAIIKKYNVYTGEPMKIKKEIDIERYKMEKEILEREIEQYQKELDRINLLLNDIKKYEGRKTK